MRKYPIPELANALGAFVSKLRSRSTARADNTVRPVLNYAPFWPAARGASGFAVQDIEEAEDWEDLLVLTPHDKREYRKWVASTGKPSS